MFTRAILSCHQYDDHLLTSETGHLDDDALFLGLIQPAQFFGKESRESRTKKCEISLPPELRDARVTQSFRIIPSEILPRDCRVTCDNELSKVLYCFFLGVD